MRDVISARGYLTGPRWIDLEGDLRRAALVADVDIRTKRSAHFLSQTVTYTMSGSERSVNLLRQAIRRALEQQ